MSSNVNQGQVMSSNDSMPRNVMGNQCQPSQAMSIEAKQCQCEGLAMSIIKVK